MPKLTIGLVLPDVLGTYGDDGNALVLRQRARMRGIEAEIVPIKLGEAVPDSLDVYTVGGGEDTAQITAVRQLKADGGLFTALDRGAVLFAVCAGYQICGSSFTIGAHDEIIEGLGLLDVQTRRGPQRAVGEVLHHWTRPDGTESLVTGFENHGGWTTLGTDATALADVEIGWGNGDRTTEGAIQGNIIGTYPHGPILARNPELADFLLERSLGTTLEPLDKPEIEQLRERRIRSARAGKP